MLGVAALFTAALCVGCSEPSAADDDRETPAAGGKGGAGGLGGAPSVGGGGALPVVEPTVLLPKSGLTASEVVVVANARDPQSVEVAAHYVQARGLPPENRITLDFAVPSDGVMTEATFDAIHAEVQAATPATAQAYAIAWTSPYRVDCMSLTSAFAFGFDTSFCGGCVETAQSGYFNSRSAAPRDDHGVMPTMMLAGASADDVKALIDRGVAADDTFPDGDGYMVRTTDTARSVRWPQFAFAANTTWSHPGGLEMTYVDNADGSGDDFIADAQDVLFYFTGLANVPQIDTNSYLPGAVADHLTSFGGQVPTSSQMSVVAWLAAGATGSYGTVVEPCNYPAKFPDVGVMATQYFRGNTLIEAYFKSVAWPGEGLFVGEPLARPWGRDDVTWADGVLTIETNTLIPGFSYELVSAPSEDGPWTTAMTDIQIDAHRRATISFEPTTSPVYRLRLAGDL